MNPCAATTIQPPANASWIDRRTAKFAAVVRDTYARDA
jgi:hypothetical protein